MNISPLSTILLAALPAAYTNALSCQSKFATPCRAESDKRYDPNASADLIQQNPIWEGTEGFWVQPVTASFDIAGQPLQPTWFYEGGAKGMPGYGIPYKQSTSTSFINRTIVGSRMFMHIYSIFEPADAEFCAKDVPVGAANVIGEGSCGGTGFVMSSDQIGTSTFERDGTLHTFFTAIGLPYDYSGVSIPNSIATPIGSDTIVYQAGVPGGISLAYTEVSANIENTVIGGSSSDINMVPSKDPNDPNISHTIYNGTKVEESEWVSSLLAAYDAAKVPVEERVAVPMTTACLTDAPNCPSSEDFCTIGKDPACSDSLYQEPAATMKPGYIALFVILGIGVLIAAFYAVYRKAISDKEKKMRRLFVQKVAKRVDLKGSVSQLPPIQLVEEFKRIDQGLRTSGTNGDGFISRQEMWDFISSGKAGEMSESDFDTLYNAMDIDGDGKVNFVEFCAFFTSCGDEVKAFNGDGAGASNEAILREASMRISTLKPLATQDLED